MEDDFEYAGDSGLVIVDPHRKTIPICAGHLERIKELEAERNELIRANKELTQNNRNAVVEILCLKDKRDWLINELDRVKLERDLLKEGLLRLEFCYRDFDGRWACPVCAHLKCLHGVQSHNLSCWLAELLK
jgi:hypothetical protein